MRQTQGARISSKEKKGRCEDGGKGTEKLKHDINEDNAFFPQTFSFLEESNAGTNDSITL